MNKIDPLRDFLIRDLGLEGSFSAADLAGALAAVAKASGPQAALNLLLRGEVVAGWRKPSLALYDHTLHLIGGGEKYGCTLAAGAAGRFRRHPDRPPAGHDRRPDEVVRPRPVALPGQDHAPGFFRRQAATAGSTPTSCRARTENPFLAVSRESGNYDFFVNNSMLEMVYPLANVPLFVCHFPERPNGAYFYVQHYRHLIYNSLYTAAWIEKKWGIIPRHHIYPPVDMEPAARETPAKEKVILAVARFESGGSKQQLEMIAAFARLRAEAPQAMRRLEAGALRGQRRGNPYLERIRAALSDAARAAGASCRSTSPCPP